MRFAVLDQRTVLRLALLGAAVTGLPALAAGVNELPQVVVSASTPVDEKPLAASEGIVLREQIDGRPWLRPAEVMETVPGVVVTQHSGDGKANQYFLRGFNLDHGTDISIYALGMPVNQRSHAHGQGYSDLNFLIPELVDTLSYRKGPYLARDGDFATAGAVDIDYVNALDKPFASLGFGARGFRRLLVAGSWRTGVQPDGGDAGGRWLLALEDSRNQGPWTVPEGLSRQNLFLRYSEGTDSQGWRLSLVAYRARWTATDQVPQRAIDQGLIGPYGSLDPTTGGRTDLTALTWNARGDNADGPWQANAYLASYGLDLYSNFTYAMDNPLRGDQFRQRDQRVKLGGDLSQTLRYMALGVPQSTTVGVQVRQDRIGDLALQLTQAQQVYDTVRRDQVRETSAALFVDQATQWTPWLRSRGGLRVDQFIFNVRSDTVANSGGSRAAVVSPKFGLTFTPWRAFSLFANWGRGFHSNDARGVVISVDPDPRSATYGQTVDKVTPLARANAYEWGATWTTPALHLSAALWFLKLKSELVYVGDAGSTEAGRPSARRGLELAAVWRLAGHWLLDADATWTRARYDDADPSGPYIEGAVRRTASAGLSYRDAGPWSAALRLRHIGPRQLSTDGSQIGAAATVLNGRLAYRVNHGLTLALEVLNLTNRRYADMAYLYASQLRGESVPVDDLHVHPAEPRAARLVMKWTLE